MAAVNVLVACVVAILLVRSVQSALPFTPSGSDLGETCRYDGMCTASNSYCKQGFCECRSGHRNVNHNCVKVIELGEPCILDLDCAHTYEASRCADNVCKRCSEGSEREYSRCTEVSGGCAYHEYDGHCFNYRRIGERCESSEDCWIYPNTNRTRECVLNMCICVQSLETMSGPLPDGVVDQCVPRSSTAASCAPISMILVLTALLVATVLSEN